MASFAYTREGGSARVRIEPGQTRIPPLLTHERNGPVFRLGLGPIVTTESLGWATLLFTLGPTMLPSD